jgi:hypothetical protein
MLPGLSHTVEAAIRKVMTPKVTGQTVAGYDAGDYTLYGGRDEETRALGVQQMSGPEIAIVVTDPERPVGDIRVQTGGAGSVLFIDNRAWQGTLNASIRLLGEDCAVLFNDIGPAGYVTLNDVFLRSHQQFLFWGRGATAVGCNVEIEGIGHGLAVGDDALISNGVWVRNYNMHALHDLRSGARIGRAPVTTVIERHVWLGQDVLLLGCERIGSGAVVGARSFVNRPVPPCTLVVGTPAAVLRDGVSWGRDTYTMTGTERVALGWPEAPAG